MKRWCIALSMAAELILSGCSMPELYAGTAVVQQEIEPNGELNEETEIEYYDGTSIKKKAVSIVGVLSSEDSKRLMEQYEDAKLEKPADSSIPVCVKIEGAGEDGWQIPVGVRNQDGGNFKMNGIKIDVRIFYLGDDWYVMYIPGGSRNLMITVGNRGFVLDLTEDILDVRKGNENG